jgi:ketosteroid isomerase-like protein
MKHQASPRSAEQIAQAFDAAWATADIEGLIALYAPDATIESPLVARILGKPDGVCRGHAEIRALANAILKQRGPRWGRHEPPVVRGNTLFIEYRRALPEGEQLDYVDVIEVESGAITSLRAYWGWKALATLAP